MSITQTATSHIGVFICTVCVRMCMSLNVCYISACAYSVTTHYGCVYSSCTHCQRVYTILAFQGLNACVLLPSQLSHSPTLTRYLGQGEDGEEYFWVLNNVKREKKILLLFVFQVETRNVTKLVIDKGQVNVFLN